MNSFKKKLLASRRISVWGIGYLGYTFLLRMQSQGFFADIHDFTTERQEALLDQAYPSREQKETWSAQGNIPALDLTRIAIAHDPSAMFGNQVHVISFPGCPESIDGNRLQELAKLFIDNKEKVNNAVVIFQSAETPGSLEHYFIDPLLKAGVQCSFATAFRSDWIMEEFLQNKDKLIVSGHDSTSLEKSTYFLKLLKFEHLLLNSIKEAELYENAKIALKYTASSLINQLTLAYQSTDMRRMAQLLANEFNLQNPCPSVGSLGYKVAAAINHLQEGSRYPPFMTLLNNADHANLSIILYYAEMIKKYSYGTVAILGISEKGDLKDIRLTPSLILAEKLITEGITVTIHDPYFTAEEVKKLLPSAITLNDLTGKLSVSCIILMTGHRSYRYLTPKDLEDKGISTPRLIIDNVGLWSDYRFSEKTLYHIPGDGNLIRFQQ